MKTRFLRILAVGLLLGAVEGKDDPQMKKQAPLMPEQKVESDKLIADLRLARQALEEAHSGIYRYTSKSELDRLFDQAEKSLTKPMSALEFYRILAPVVAAIKCGHTAVRPPEGSEKDLRILPLNVRLLKGKPFVYRDLSAEKLGLAGKEIRSINGVASEDIAKTMLAASSGDGDIQTARMRRISGLSFGSNLAYLIGLKSPYEVTCWDTNKRQEVKATLDGISLPALKEASKKAYPQDQRPKESGQLSFFDDGKIALMKINGFGGFM